jgi:hypothetical protein
MFHARSAARGELVQAITGIDFYYRQFGYEYALDLGGRRLILAANVPPAKEGETAAFALRPATVDDVPHLVALYNQQRKDSLVWNELNAADWRYYTTVWETPVVRSQDPLHVGLSRRMYMVVDGGGQVCGYAALATKRRGRVLTVINLELYPHVNWQAAIHDLLRAFCAAGRETPGQPGEAQPFGELSLSLGRTHAAYDVLDETLLARSAGLYAWYVRVADVPGFVRHVAPVLEQRLAGSILAGYSGELRCDFYKGGLRLLWEKGKLLAAEPWTSTEWGDDAELGCPPLVFLQLLFGYHSIAELEEFYPDVETKNRAAALLADILFPKRQSVVRAMDFT